jgi:hypothetical protein
MTRKEVSVQRGPQGTTLTTASTGASQVTLNTGAGIYDAGVKGPSGALSSSGGFGAKFTNAANTQALARILGTAANAKYGFNFVVTLPAELDANNITFASFRHSSGTCLTWQINTAGDIVVYDQAATPQFTNVLLHTNGSWALGASYRIRGYVTVGSTTAGRSERHRPPHDRRNGRRDDRAALNTVAITTGNYTANNMVGGDFGIVSANNQPHSVGIADVVLDDGATSAPVDLFGAAMTLTPNSGNTPLSTTAAITTTPHERRDHDVRRQLGRRQHHRRTVVALPSHTYNADGSYTATATVTNT